MLRTRQIAFLAIAILAFGGGSRALAAQEKPAKPSKEDFATKGSPDLQKLMHDFASRRDTFMAEREALLNQLKNATEEQKKAILEKMQAQQKDLIETERALQKQIRDEMRKLRQTTPPGR